MVTPVNHKFHGFSLIEIAIVLFVMTLLLGGLLPIISTQIEQQRGSETRKQLDEIQQALIGYAISNGRLPCPASDTSNGVEDPVGGGSCTLLYNGFVPAATLGLATGTDNQGHTGFAVDAWGNRVRYAVTAWSSNAFTIPNGMKLNGISNLAPDLLVCSTATGISASSCASGTSLTSNGTPAVIFSTGKNGSQGGAGADEQANLDSNKTFISHTPAPAPNEFDDIVVWISPNILVSRMVAAGQLP